LDLIEIEIALLFLIKFENKSYICHENILRFYIPVDDELSVKVFQALKNLHDDALK